MFQELRRVQKTMVTQEQVVHYLLTYLHSVDARIKRDNRNAAFQAQGGVAGDGGASQMAPVDEEPSTPLQQAAKLLNDMNSEIQFNMNTLESMSDMQNRMAGAVPTPPLDQSQRNGIARPPTSGGSSSTLAYSKLNGGELESVVYPVGTTNGIDPMYADHVNNIPYPMPTKELDPSDPRRQYADGRKKNMYQDPGWIRSPRILLVEDDQTCRQIGGKFLQSFCCIVDTAVRLFPPPP
jgi:osomolarity two-component system response regulator SKN7